MAAVSITHTKQPDWQDNGGNASKRILRAARHVFFVSLGPANSVGCKAQANSPLGPKARPRWMSSCTLAKESVHPGPYSFAHAGGECQNTGMKKPTSFVLSRFGTILAITTIVAGAVFSSPAQARQTPASSGQQSSASGAQQAPASPPAKSAATSGSQSPSTTPKKPVATKIGQSAAKKTTAAPLTLDTPKDKVSYAIGMNVGRRLESDLKQLKQADTELDTTILVRAIKDVLSNGKALMTDQEAQTTLTTLQADLRKRQQEKQQELAETNKKESDEFLAANKTKEGVVSLPSGLQYKILQEGIGPKPAATDAVVVNYRGTLLNGTEFDSSYKHGQPFTAQVVGGIIRGWSEALQLMPVGSKWQLFIPSDLAYGAQGRAPVIGPNSALVFEVELISIQPKSPPAPAPAPAQAAPNAAPASTPSSAPSPTPALVTPKPVPTPTPTPTQKP